MSTIDDLLAAINTYPNGNVVISVINFSEPGTHINQGELCSFDVRVENNGQLDMKNVTLHVEGSGWTSVAISAWHGGPSSFSNSSISYARDVDAHASTTFGKFYMMADTATPDQGQAARDLITVHVQTFDADLYHILRDHGHHAGNPEESYRRHIHPS